jgi:competence protein ComEC
MVHVNHDPQGDAHLIIDNQSVVMIDTGDPDQSLRYLVPYLIKLGISRIEHVFITHPHDDHFGGVIPLIENGITIEHLYFNELPSSVSYGDKADFQSTISAVKKSGTLTHDIGKGFFLNLPSSKLSVLYAPKSLKVDGKLLTINDYSLIIQWDAGGYRSLFTGDLGSISGTAIARSKYYKADILKVPHHGVSDIAPNQFFDTVSPKLNMFPSTLPLWTHERIAQSKAWTLQSGVFYCNNGLNGTVKLTFFEQQVYAQSQRPSQACPNGKLDIEPGEHIDRVNTMPYLNLLLED